ncbi:MAG TPA: hypothetical protein VKO87_08450, partial [Gemmatimonadaceae bacterium]|nr:hypothetical protein [Gemmatimonadaceae bacterium]
MRLVNARNAVVGLALVSTGFSATPNSMADLRPQLSPVALADDTPAVPFGAGEKSSFEVRFSGLRVGS